MQRPACLQVGLLLDFGFFDVDKLGILGRRSATGYSNVSTREYPYFIPIPDVDSDIHDVHLCAPQPTGYTSAITNDREDHSKDEIEIAEGVGSPPG